jgi:hypothetical protein
LDCRQSGNLNAVGEDDYIAWFLVPKHALNPIPASEINLNGRDPSESNVRRPSISSTAVVPVHDGFFRSNQNVHSLEIAAI